MQPPSLADLATLNQHINAWLAQMTTLRAEAPDHPMRAMLDQAVEQVRKGQATLNAEYETTMDEIRRRVENVHQINAETMKQVEALRAKEVELAAGPPAPAAPPPVDGQLGFTLRQELLDRYAPAKVEDSGRLDEGSVSKHWEETSVAETPVPKTPAPPTRAPPAAPPKKPPQSDDVSDLSTRSWDDEQG